VASRYHWIIGGSDSIGAFTAPAAVNLALPAGAIVKRFQCRNMNVTGHNSGSDNTYGRTYSWTHLVRFTAGVNSGRTIYQSRRAIPVRPTTFFAAAVPVFDFWFGAGDEILGVNQRCSYGRATDPAATISYQPSNSSFNSFTPSGTPGGEIQYSFAVLYYL